MSAVVSTLPSIPSAASRFAGRRVHFIGIGGCGMSGLAQMLLDAGALVSGSEPRPNEVTALLQRRGARISLDQDGSLLDAAVDLVVRTAAVPDGNPEFEAARGLGLPTLKYAQLLGAVMDERFGVAIAGTHGKSTTTAMTAFALLSAGADPSFVVGGTVPQLGGGSRSGHGPAFVAEACEYDRSFLNLRPDVAVITNIDNDHLDCFGTIEAIVDSFSQFAARVKPGGTIIAHVLDERVRTALQGTSIGVQWCALDSESADWTVTGSAAVNGCWGGQVLHRRHPVGALRLGVAGRHNLLNGLMAIAAAHAAGADAAAATASVGRFTGVDRRMTVMGACRGATVVDDYGHHPTEVRATLAALRERYAPRRLLCVFQPHQASRTRRLLEEFAGSFGSADEVFVTDIYTVRDREEDRLAVSGGLVAERIGAAGVAARHFGSQADLLDAVRATVAEGDLVVTLGAGDVWKTARALVLST